MASGLSVLGGHMRELYTLTVDYEGKKYIGITTKYDRDARQMGVGVARGDGDRVMSAGLLVSLNATPRPEAPTTAPSLSLDDRPLLKP